MGLSMKANTKIVAIVGPKGGVGKTTISANLAIALSVLGKKVIAVDLDLGASNLHTLFGIRETKATLDDFVLNKIANLPDIVLETSINNLGIICGGNVPGIANLNYNKKLKLIHNLSQLKTDFVLLDLGAGASFNVVDFLIIAQEGILVTTPEVPSLLNAYSFIKTLIFRRLTLHFKHSEQTVLIELLDKARDFDSYPKLKTMEGFMEAVNNINVAEANSIRKILTNYRPIVVVNRARSGKDAETGKVLQNLMNQYLSIKSSIILTVREDAAVGTAVARLKPVLLEAPNSLFAKDIEMIARVLHSAP
jgi:flagellar biosynthesis protein FlhG